MSQFIWQFNQIAQVPISQTWNNACTHIHKPIIYAFSVSPPTLSLPLSIRHCLFFVRHFSSHSLPHVCWLFCCLFRLCLRLNPRSAIIARRGVADHDGTVRAWQDSLIAGASEVWAPSAHTHTHPRKPFINFRLKTLGYRRPVRDFSSPRSAAQCAHAPHFIKFEFFKVSKFVLSCWEPKTGGVWNWQLGKMLA